MSFFDDDDGDGPWGSWNFADFFSDAGEVFRGDFLGSFWRVKINMLGRLDFSSGVGDRFVDDVGRVF